MLGTRSADWELKNEKNKANVRWLLTALITGYLAYLNFTGKGEAIGTHPELFNWYYIGILAGSMLFINLLVVIYLNLVQARGGRILRIVKYFTMSVDFVATSAVLVCTGGVDSRFFVVYFIIIVSNSLRYGMRLAVAGLFIFNFLYAGILLIQYPALTRLDPPDGASVPEFHSEVLKMAGFWIVGLYSGYMARRFQILQGEVERYQDLVKKLMARRKAPAKAASSSESA